MRTHFTESEILKRLIEIHQEDFEAMSKDAKINKFFWTEGEIKRKIKKLKSEN